MKKFAERVHQPSVARSVRADAARRFQSRVTRIAIERAVQLRRANAAEGTAGPGPGGGIIQCYRTAGDYRISTNDFYISNGTSGLLVLRANGVPNPLSSKLSRTAAGKYGSQSYDEWVPLFDVREDCGEAMEEVMYGQQLASGNIYSQFAPGLPFGDTPRKNIQYGAATKANAAANPAVGEAYVAVRHNKQAGHPYHAAAVVAKDGDDDVTLEASAPPAGKSSKRVTPVYDMYGRLKDAGQSFWDTYAVDPVKGDKNPGARYGKDATVSVVSKLGSGAGSAAASATGSTSASAAVAAAAASAAAPAAAASATGGQP